MTLICITETDLRYTPMSCPFLSIDGICMHPTKVNSGIVCHSKPDDIATNCDLRRLASRVVVTAVERDQDAGYVPVFAACLVALAFVVGRVIVITVKM